MPMVTNQTEFFRCAECEGNFPTNIMIHRPGDVICEYCWEEINEHLRKPKKGPHNVSHVHYAAKGN